MNKTNLKQGTLRWETARDSRVGSSEIFDIVRYYASDTELHNCGIDPEKFSAESPFTTAWALYHKMRDDGLYCRESIPPELSEYGHALEPYGHYIMQKGRNQKLKKGEVFATDRLIASLDISGISEELDERPFDYGHGFATVGKRFVCEQKTIMPNVLKSGLPMKYIIQAQYQTLMTKADFYILQIMVLKNDTTFERGKITAMTKKKMCEYLDAKMTVTHLYFHNNEHLSSLIESCITRFFDDVDNEREPTPFIEHDSQRRIIESIRINSHYNNDMVLEYDLSDYVEAKNESEAAKTKQESARQRIIEAAKKHNTTRFVSADGTTGSFSKDGKFLLKQKREV